MFMSDRLLNCVNKCVELDLTGIIIYFFFSVIGILIMSEGYYVFGYLFNVLILNRFMVKIVTWQEEDSDILTRAIVLFSGSLYAVFLAVVYVESLLPN